MKTLISETFENYVLNCIYDRLQLAQSIDSHVEEFENMMTVADATAILEACNFLREYFKLKNSFINFNLN